MGCESVKHLKLVHLDTIINCLIRSHASDTQPQQPDGGELEDCTMIQLDSLHSMNQWHDVPCSSDEVKQFICELSLTVSSSK